VYERVCVSVCICMCVSSGCMWVMRKTVFIKAQKV